jgi:hypothetical protein
MVPSAAELAAPLMDACGRHIVFPKNTFPAPSMEGMKINLIPLTEPPTELREDLGAYAEVENIHNKPNGLNINDTRS